MPRHEVHLDLATLDAFGAGPPRAGLALRHPSRSDAAALAELMVDAYRGTIDYDGETLEDAREEVGRFLDGAYGPPILACSWLYSAGETIVAACLAARWEGHPLISYVMVRAAWKNQGLGTGILRHTLRSLAGAGHEGVRAVITEGNTPSEIVFRRAGFVRLD